MMELLIHQNRQIGPQNFGSDASRLRKFRQQIEADRTLAVFDLRQGCFGAADPVRKLAETQPWLLTQSKGPHRMH